MTAGAVLLVLLVLTGGCASLPPRQPMQPSQAIVDGHATTLGRIATASLIAEEDVAGFRALPTGSHAYHARQALARRAEKSLDVQAYHIHDDAVGHAFLRELRDAAQRGVRVRLLVDDFHAAPLYPLLQGLAAHPKAEVRLFNPLPARHGQPLTRLVLSLPDFQRVNHRMHNKLMVADNALALFGGRNIADEYFMRSGVANFIDFDLLAAGPVVPELSQSFDRYWNSEQVWSLANIVPPRMPAADLREDFERRSRRFPPPEVPRLERDPLGQTPVEDQLATGRLLLVPGRAQVHADAPTKVVEPKVVDQPTAAMRGKLGVIAEAKKEVVIVSPYFLPGNVGMRMMREASLQKQTAVIITNSLGSTDEPLVHRAYSRYRVEMLRMGMQIYEFSPELTRRGMRFGDFGESVSRLHAKVAVVDRRWLLVGSVNLDARSAIVNTELSVNVDCPPLAEGALKLLAADDYGSMYQLRLAEDGKTVQWWTTDSGGRTTVTTDEPHSSPWLRFKLWVQSLLISEDSL